jgi:hypothetical protein
LEQHPSSSSSSSSSSSTFSLIAIHAAQSSQIDSNQPRAPLGNGCKIALEIFLRVAVHFFSVGVRLHLVVIGTELKCRQTIKFPLSG